MVLSTSLQKTVGFAILFLLVATAFSGFAATALEAPAPAITTRRSAFIDRTGMTKASAYESEGLRKTGFSWHAVSTTTRRCQPKCALTSSKRATKLTSQNDQGTTKDNRKLISRRWNGNYRAATKRLRDTSKCKRMTFNVTTAIGAFSAIGGATATVHKAKWESLQHVLTKAIMWKLLLVDKYGSRKIPSGGSDVDSSNHNSISSLFANDSDIKWGDDDDDDPIRVDIERDIGDPDYLPDVVVTRDGDDCSTAPLIWVECGRVKVEKELALLRRYPDTHLVRAHWGKSVTDLSLPLREALQNETTSEYYAEMLSLRSQPYTFACVKNEDSIWAHVSDEPVAADDGGGGAYRITVEPCDLEWEDL